MGKTQGTRGGYTLVELTVAVMVMTITLGGVCTSLLSTVSLSRTNRQTTAGLDAARSRIEAMRGEIFEEVFLRYNATALDDPVLGLSPGPTFDVRGLTVRNNDPDGFVGEIFFPGDGITLREDWNDPELGMPRDLNGDDVIDDLDHKRDYVILPVRIVVSWEGVMGARQLEVVTQLSDYGAVR